MKKELQWSEEERKKKEEMEGESLGEERGIGKWAFKLFLVSKNSKTEQ